VADASPDRPLRRGPRRQALRQRASAT
jgi:hypothetical protein